MISIVIPLYNKAAYIEKAVASVVSQTYKEFELIIVDDGSTDESLSIVENIEDDRLKIISTKNSGAAAARNFGIEEALNEYIALLDADDWWAPTYLEEIVNAINAFPGHQLFATGRIHVFESKEVEYTNRLLPNSNDTGLVNHFQVIAKHLPAVHSSNLVVQKEYFVGFGGFKKGMHHFEDHECWLRLAIDQSIVFVNKPLAYYNKTAHGSMSNNPVDSRDLKDYFATMVSVKEQLTGKEKRCFKKFYQRFAKWSYLKYTKDYTALELQTLKEPLQELLSENELKTLEVLSKTGIADVYQYAKRLLDGGR